MQLGPPCLGNKQKREKMQERLGQLAKTDCKMQTLYFVMQVYIIFCAVSLLRAGQKRWRHEIGVCLQTSPAPKFVHSHQREELAEPLGSFPPRITS